MILRKYVKGDISLNKRSYISTVITIFLAVLVLSTFTFGIFSYYKSYRDIIEKGTGGYHFRIVNTVSNKDARSLIENRHVKKLGLYNSETLSKGFGSKKETLVFKMDENALSTIKSWLKEGEMPALEEIIISNDMAREIDKSVGDYLEIEGENYKISGIYYDTNYEYRDEYTIFLNRDRDVLLETEEEFSPFLWYKNIFKTYKLSEEIMKNLETEDITYNYNKLYLDRSFVFDADDDLLKDHFIQIVQISLFLLLNILFYSIITNLFLVQEAKSIKEYSRLKALGGTNKDISKIVRLKAIYISQLPIILGILTSLEMVKFLFWTLKKVETYFLENKGIMESAIELNLKFDFKLLIFIYLVSTLIIYMGTRKPIKKLRKNSILDGLRGDLKLKEYKKYDLKSSGDIEKDLSKQFYKNGKKNFIWTGLTLKIGFILMAFIMMIISYYNMEEMYNTIDKYTYYNIQASYATVQPLNEDLLSEIKSLYVDSEDFINFRNEFVYVDYSEDFIDKDYIESGSLDNLKEEIYDLENLRLSIIGIEDYKFNELVSERGLDPNKYKGNKVLLLNRMGENFNVPASKMVEKAFLRDDVKTISLSEYGSVFKTRGYEFELDVEDKIDKPLFEYQIRKDRLNCYMPKSEYVKLLDEFERIADMDQFEYIAIKSDDIKKDQELIRSISLEHFKDGDFDLESKIDDKNLAEKRIMIGNVLSLFLSFFFIVIGFSNCYFAFYNLFISRKDELTLYRAIGMDDNLLEGILRREKNKIIFSFIGIMPIGILILAIVVSSLSKVFNVLDILLNMNYLFLAIYILVIYISISRMYNTYRKELI